MTITTNSDYTVITITSTNLTSFVNIDTVTLEGKINCDGDYSDTIIEADVTAGAFTLDTTTLFGEATLDDSIYSFKLIILNDDASVITEHACLFVDNETTCNVMTEVAEAPSAERSLQLALYVRLLTDSQDCECDCSDLCTIYKYLINELRDCTSC